MTTASSASERASSGVLILGGSGFIGSRLGRVLDAQAIPFHIGDLKPSAAFPNRQSLGDVTRPESLPSLLTNTAAIINLAAEHRDDVRPISLYQSVNVDGAANVCQAARAAGVSKIIFTSSVAVYGFHGRPIDENGPFQPFNQYGITKLAAEKIYLAWAAEDARRSLVILRPTVVFGEGNRGNVYNLLRQVATGRFLMVGSGANVKSMAYVGNVAAFLAHALSLGPGVHIANYVDQPDLTTQQLIGFVRQCLGRSDRTPQIPRAAAMLGGHCFDVLAKVSGRRFPISAIRVKKFCETTQFRADRIPQLGFEPPYSLTEGLARTIQAEFGSQSGEPASSPVSAD